MALTTEQMRAYQKDRYNRRMQEARTALGGACASCGSTSRLEVDHLDTTLKSANLSSMTNLGDERWRAELAKCQLLCKTCHTDRTRGQRMVSHGGGKTGRKGCKCAPCKNRRRLYAQERRRSAG